MYNRVVITGSAGLIGSHLATRFLSLGYEVLGIDNLVGGYSSNIPNNKKYTHANIDITDSKRVKTVISSFDPSIVIHCAALAHEGLSVFSPSTITNNIFSGTISIASAAIASGAKLFINTSSMARYGDVGAPFSEHTKPSPVDPYGLAKLQAEQQLNLLAKIHSIKVVHMVPHNVCGPNQCYSDPFRNVLSIFANRISKDKPVYIYGDGLQKRSFSHVEDCVDAYIKVVELHNQINSGEVFNIGPTHGSEITITELADKVAKHYNKVSDKIYIDARPQEVKNAWVSTEKAELRLDYKTKFDVEDVVRDTVTWIKSSPNREFNYHIDLEIINDKTPITWKEKLFND